MPDYSTASRFYSERTCPCCGGQKYGAEQRQYLFNGLSIGDFMTMPFAELINFVEESKKKVKDVRISFAFNSLHSFLKKAIDLNLGHLFFHRAIPTLSGGELQRLRMVQVFNAQLSDMLVVLDEPLAGLSGREKKAIYENIIALCDRHTVLVVDHSDVFVSKARRIYALGPGGGSKGGQMIDDGRFNPSGFAHLSEDDYVIWTRRVTPQEDDIVFSYEATLGRYVLIPKDFYGCLGRRLGIVRCDKAKVNPRWLYYFFLSPEWTHFTQSHKVRGSTVDRLSVDDFPGYEIPLPSLEEQNRAVDAIFPVDQKIDLNTRLCAELECMARTLYDYWFVQFDFPDENGKPYRSSGGEMVWCQELRREVPKGWRAGKYSDLIDSVRTGLNPRQNFTFSEGGIQYLTVKNLTQEGRIDFTGCDTIDESARSIVHRRSDIRIGDVLFASIAPLGRCYLIQSNPDDWDINESVFSLRPNYSCVGVLSFLPDLWLLQDRFWPVP